jgi:hypothetical protein
MVAAVLATASLTSPALAVNKTLQADRDNTIFSVATGNSLGAAQSFYAGNTARTSGDYRRALVRFSLAGVPAGSRVNAASVLLFQTKNASFEPTLPTTLHRLTADWGEGTSDGAGGGALATAGDATWLKRFFNTADWTTPGGDYVTAASASLEMTSAFQYFTWTSPGLANDVSGWLAAPSTNFGWIVRGDETQLQTARQFASRQNFNTTIRPKLVVNYTGPGDANADDSVNFDDLLLLAANYNQSTGVSWEKGDFTRDGTVNFDDLLVLAANYNTSFSGSPDWALAQAVPEPLSVSFTVVVAAMMLARLRR